MNRFAVFFCEWNSHGHKNLQTYHITSSFSSQYDEFINGVSVGLVEMIHRFEFKILVYFYWNYNVRILIEMF